MTCFSRSLLLLVLGAPLVLADCPTPDPSIACTKQYDPVTCDGCVYENMCEATAAGQTNCAQSCEKPADDVACTKEYSPVACGGFIWCIYDNLCLAKAAGKSEADCTRSCPTVPQGIACTADYSPQFCGGCYYTSLCEATAAWEGAGLSADICVDISEYVTAPVGGTTCPEVVVPTNCSAVFDPVTCDGDCYYNNECLATEAGATNCNTTCEAPPENDCGSEKEGFICRNGCVFSNGCLAEAAGFTPSTDCAPFCRFDLENLGVTCPTNYAPVYCLGCELDNECIAEAVGFNVAKDCQSIETPVTKSTAGGSDVTTSGSFESSLLIAAIATTMAVSISYLA